MVQDSFRLDVVSIRLVKESPIFSEKKITAPEHAVELLGKEMCELDREVVCVLNLKVDGTPINCNFASMGAVDMALAEPRELFKTVILSNAVSMILIHNHPSNDLFPSEYDTHITDRMLQLSKLMGIRLLDHIIVGGDNRQYFSFREKKLIDYEPLQYEKDYSQLNFEGYAKVAETGRSR